MKGMKILRKAIRILGAGCGKEKGVQKKREENRENKHISGKIEQSQTQ